jgi:hypothetical protein
MAAEVKREKNRRAALKRWLGEDSTKLESLIIAKPLDLSAIQLAYTCFTSRIEALQQAQFAIESLLDDPETDFNNELPYQQQLHELRERVEKILLPAVHVSAQTSTAGMASFPSTSSAGMPTSQVRLPKYNLPHFSGNCVDFLGFKESFLSAVDHCDDRSKLNYLMNGGALSGPAKAAIEGLALNADNWKIAWEILEEQFGRSAKLRKAHYRALLSLSTPKPEAASLRDFYNEIYKHTRCLERLGVKEDTFGEILCEIVSQHLPASIYDEWSRHLGSKDDDKANLK